jgi:hypothetical protein
VKRYGEHLKQASELPDFVRSIRNDNIELACEHPYRHLPELYGDLYALNYVDLDREGLSEYKIALENFNRSGGTSGEGGSLNSSLGKKHFENTSLNSSWSHDESTTTAATDNADAHLVEKILSQVNVNHEGKISLNEAKKIFYQLNVLLGKEFNEKILTNLFKSIGIYTTCFIDFDQFKRSLFTIL